MAYSKLFAIYVGDKMKTYGGFSCISPDTVVTIECDAEGMFFRCADGKHYLKSQVSDDGVCLGLTALT